MSVRSWFGGVRRIGAAVLAWIRPKRSPPVPEPPARIALCSSPKSDAGAVADFPLDLARTLFDREGIAGADIAIRGVATRMQSARLAEGLTGIRQAELETEEEFVLFAAKRPEG